MLLESGKKIRGDVVSLSLTNTWLQFQGLLFPYGRTAQNTSGLAGGTVLKRFNFDRLDTEVLGDDLVSFEKPSGIR